MNSTKILFFFLFALSIVLHSCNIETAKPPLQKHLIILSDYLDQSDTVLFSTFITQNNVSVQIVKMQSDKIIGLIRNEGSNIQADVIMVKSISDIHKMSKRSLLQRINFSNELTPDQQKYSSWLSNFIGFGIDPYVVAYTPKNNIYIYNDLLKGRFINALNDRDRLTMLSPIMQKLKKVEANRWVKNFVDSSLTTESLTDSLNADLPILTLYSDFSSNNDTLLNYSYRYLRYPNSKSTGTFFNLRTIAIIDQAENYSIAKDFVFYCLNEGNNQRINAKLNTFSILPKQEVFRKYAVSQDKLVEYNQIVTRILQKIH